MSPAVRHVLSAVAAGVSAVGALIAAGTITDAPEWLGVAVAVSGAMFAALGIVPGQVGGTQQGIVNPSVVEPPDAAIDESGQGLIGVLILVLVAALAYWLLAVLTGSAIVAVVGAVVVLLAGAGSYGRW